MNVYKIAAVLLLATAPTSAMDWLSSAKLESSCDAFLNSSDDSEAALCLTFVQGFLAGAEAAHAQNPIGSRAKALKDETFSERATRTRLSTLQLMQVRSGKPAYCLDETLSPVEIVETVAGYLDSHEEVMTLTNTEAVYEALVHEFPCES